MERQHFPSDLILIVPRTNNADEIHTEDESTAQSALEQIMSYNNQDGFDDEQSSGAVLDFPNDGYNNTVNTSNGLHHRSYSRSPSPILPLSSSSSRHDDDSYNDSYTNQHSYSPRHPTSIRTIPVMTVHTAMATTSRISLTHTKLVKCRLAHLLAPLPAAA